MNKLIITLLLISSTALAQRKRISDPSYEKIYGCDMSVQEIDRKIEIVGACPKTVTSGIMTVPFVVGYYLGLKGYKVFKSENPYIAEQEEKFIFRYSLFIKRPLLIK